MNKKLLILIIGGFLLGLGLAWFLAGGFKYPLTGELEYGGLPANQKNNCVISGCSSEICSEKSLVSTCEEKPEYACYKNAVCERQPSGKCDWTRTEELEECLAVGF